MRDFGIYGKNTAELKAKEEHEEADRIDPLAHADGRLAEFKIVTEVEWENASSLYEGAKNLWEEVNYHWTQGKKKVFKGEWTVDNFDRDLMDLFMRQELVWDRLTKGAQEVQARVEVPYKHVVMAIGECKHDKGEGCDVAWGNFPTKEQAEIRKYYNMHLLPALKDVENEYQQLCGYPDGMLTQVTLLRKRAMEETAHLVEWLRQKEQHHGVGRFRLGHLLHAE